MEKKYWIARILGYSSDSEEVIQTPKQAGARPVTLDLPKDFKDFKFFSINNGRGYFSIYEGTSGIALVNDRKGIEKAKLDSVTQIKTYAPTAERFKGVIVSSQKSLIKRWKDKGMKIPSGYEIAFDETKPEPKKTEPKKTAVAKSTGLVEFIKQAAKKGAKKARVTFYPAFDPKIHSTLPEKLKKELKKSKVSVFDIPEELYELYDVSSSKNVKKIEWLKEKGIVLKAKKRQIGDSVEKSDKKRTAMAAGKRKSASGNIYYEYRKNRTDIKKKI